MNVGIVVEGPDDVAVYPVLVKRIDRGIERVHPRECGGRRKLGDKFVVFLREFAGNPAAFGIRKVFVILDSDCADAGHIEGGLREIFDRSGLRPPFEVSFHATKCKIESWLLADEEAINRVSTRRGGCDGVGRIDTDLEELKEADRVYGQVLSRVGLQDTVSVMREIASSADLDRIAQRCPGFNSFRRKAAVP